MGLQTEPSKKRGSALPESAHSKETLKPPTRQSWLILRQRVPALRYLRQIVTSCRLPSKITAGAGCGAGVRLLGDQK